MWFLSFVVAVSRGARGLRRSFVLGCSFGSGVGVLLLVRSLGSCRGGSVSGFACGAGGSVGVPGPGGCGVVVFGAECPGVRLGQCCAPTSIPFRLWNNVLSSDLFEIAGGEKRDNLEEIGAGVLSSDFRGPWIKS